MGTEESTCIWVHTEAIMISFFPQKMPCQLNLESSSAFTLPLQSPQNFKRLILHNRIYFTCWFISDFIKLLRTSLKSKRSLWNSISVSVFKKKSIYCTKDQEEEILCKICQNINNTNPVKRKKVLRKEMLMQVNLALF